MKLKSILLPAVGFLLLSALLACNDHSPDSSAVSVTTDQTTQRTTAMPYTSTTAHSPIVTPEGEVTTVPSSSATTTPAPTTPIVSTVAPITTTAEPIVTTPAPTTTVPPMTTPAPVVTTTTAPVTTTPPPETTVPIDPDKEWVVMDSVKYVNLRKKASTSSTSLTRIYAGESMELLCFSDEFAKVRYKQYTGYVHASYITRPNGQGSAQDLTVLKPVQNYSYEQMQADLQILAEKFPDQLTLSSIGKSEQGRDLTLCLLGNPNAEKNILLQAAIHGREHVVTQIAVGEIDYILHHQDMVLANGMTVAELLEVVCIHIIPMSNPDGVTISQTQTVPDLFADLYEGKSSIAKTWKANANGIDLNANFDADWDRYNSIYESTSPAYAGYKGTSPECAAESKALADYLRSTKFDLTLSYHTSGSVIYWSYDYNNHVGVNQKSKEIAELISAENGFSLGKQASSSTAGFKDYAMQAYDIPSLTIEFSQVDSPAPLSEFELTWARGKHTILISAQWVLTQ